MNFALTPLFPREWLANHPLSILFVGEGKKLRGNGMARRPPHFFIPPRAPKAPNQWSLLPTPPYAGPYQSALSARLVKVPRANLSLLTRRSPYRFRPRNDSAFLVTTSPGPMLLKRMRYAAATSFNHGETQFFLLSLDQPALGQT